MLMDAGDDQSSTVAFQRMTLWLEELGLSVPRLIAARPELGLLLLEDLGRVPVRQVLSTPDVASDIYETSMQALLTIRKAAPPALTSPNARALCDWTRLADAHYPGAISSVLDSFRAELETILADCLEQPSSVSLRDFHVDNMMWLPNRKGVRRLGLLDYQDAFLTHPVYDLVSLLTDARAEVPRETREHFIKRYAELSGDNHDALSRAFAAFSVQRNLRILGVFHRAADIDGKTHHLPKVPRVYGYLVEALAHPAFQDGRDAVTAALPAPKSLA